MIKIDLITGFLGSGKTTFLKKYAKYLMSLNLQIGILENDYGAVNVDMMLLQELRGEQCELEMVLGGCDEDCHRRRFKTKLISMGMSGYDRVLVEPSGIFDVDEFFDLLYEDPLCKWYEIGNIITIMDSRPEEELSGQSRFLLASQIANAGAVVLSKTQGISGDRIELIKQYLNRVLGEFHCSRKLEEEVFSQDWDLYSNEDWGKLLHCGYQTQADVQRISDSIPSGFKICYYMNIRLARREIQTQIKHMFEDEGCGRVFRVKGFFRLENESWLEVNATKHQMSLQPVARGQEVLIVIGEDLRQEVIGGYWKPYIKN